MKKLIIICVLLAIILGAGIFEHYYIEKTFTEFNKRLDGIATSIEDEDVDSAMKQTKELKEWWDKKRELIESVSYTPDIRTINVIIGEIEGSLGFDDLENAESKVVSLYGVIRNVKEILDFDGADIL
jgi:hypothetical protein